MYILVLCSVILTHFWWWLKRINQVTFNWRVLVHCFSRQTIVETIRLHWYDIMFDLFDGPFAVYLFWDLDSYGWSQQPGNDVGHVLYELLLYLRLVFLCNAIAQVQDFFSFNIHIHLHACVLWKEVILLILLILIRQWSRINNGNDWKIGAAHNSLQYNIVFCPRMLWFCQIATLVC